MGAVIVLDDIELDVVFKDIRNVHLSVHPPTGRVRLSAPRTANPDALRAFAISKLAWIRRHQRSLQRQEREPPRDFVDRESHYLWGKRYLLAVDERDAAAEVRVGHSRIVLGVRPGADRQTRERVVARWYRDQIREAAPELFAKWQRTLSVTLARFFVQQMKTKWGSCTPATRTVRLNTELAKKPRECLEYVIVHELAHLRDPTHGPAFTRILDESLPDWRTRRRRLNDLPVRHERWRD